MLPSVYYLGVVSIGQPPGAGELSRSGPLDTPPQSTRTSGLLNGLHGAFRIGGRDEARALT